MTRMFLIMAIVFSFFTSSIFAQTDSLKYQIEQVIATKKAHVGVSISAIEEKEDIRINNRSHFPLQSVFKLHIALTVLNEVDKGKLSLKQKILIKKSDLLPETWSPLREKYPAGNVEISLAEILQYTVSQSDNNGCDILVRLLGGIKKVSDYIHEIGINDFSIEANEEEMHQAWEVQFSNWTTPAAATELLKLFYKGKILSKKSFSFLWKIMSETSTGKERIKGQLPDKTLVAHKTGTSDTNGQGVTAAINDIGIVTLPNGRHFAVSIFVSNSKENNQTNEKIIADISKLTWDYFISHANGN